MHVYVYGISMFHIIHQSIPKAVASPLLFSCSAPGYAFISIKIPVEPGTRIQYRGLTAFYCKSRT